MINEEAIFQIEAMRRQECGAYACRDYFQQQTCCEESKCQFGTLTRPSKRWSLKKSKKCKPLGPDNRQKMVTWFQQIVDHCGFDRESVLIATSYLDRFLMTKSGVPALHNKNTFQLVAMTCLYIAIKLFEPEVINPAIVSFLSENLYSEKQITEMEMVILSALQWRVQPPTAVAFVRHFLALADLGERAKNLIIEVSGAQIENAITNYDFVGTKPSLVAAASILNTIHLMGRALLPDGSRCSLILALVEHGSNRLIYGKDMKETRDKLLNTVREKEVSNEQQSAACEVSSPSALKYFQENRAASPICVEKGPTYFMGSVASSFSNALQVGGQLWS
mmetsp:Transcript_42808/g.64424  ORF Transcript_42808/g.64424 Transcript_42808/m.64424 type:complete len:335 (+) Transcript_42808:62-1066(+)